MVNYKEYAETAAKNGFKIIPEKEWIALHNQLIRDTIFMKKQIEIDNMRIDNLLKRCENGRK